MRRALVIVGKPPVPGLAKTRLVPPLSMEDAATLYRGFLLDSVDLGYDLGWERVTVVHPGGGGPALAALLPAAVRLLEQRGQGLGTALPQAFGAHLAEGFDRVVLIGSDTPTLRPELVKQACAALEAHDMSIGPSADGGYYLISLRAAHLELFEGIDWSTARVFRQTLAQAKRLGLRVHRGPEWYDVDSPTDLDRLRHELATSADRVAPNTRAALEHIDDRCYPDAIGSGGTSSVGVRPERSA